MLKSKAWVIAVVAAAALLPAPPVQASELVKLAKLLVTGKRAPAASAEAAKPQPAATPAAERWTPPRAAEPAAPAGERSSLSQVRGGTAAAEPAEAAAGPTADWHGQDRGETAPATRPVPAEANPSRGDRFEVARDASPRKVLA